MGSLRGAVPRRAGAGGLNASGCGYSPRAPRAPGGHFLREHGGEGGLRLATGFGAGGEDQRAQVGCGQRLRDGGVQACDDRRGRARGQEGGDPGVAGIAGQRLDHGGHIGEGIVAARRGHGDGADQARAHHRRGGGHGIEAELHVARRQRLQPGAGAAIGHVLHVDPGGELEQFGRHVRPAARRSGGVVQPARLRARGGEQFGDGADRQGRRRGRQQWRAAEHGERDEGLGHVIGDLRAVRRGQHGMGGGVDQHGVAIRRGARDLAHADEAGAAAAVFHHHGPALLLRHLARDHAAEDVGRPTRREGDDEADRRGAGPGRLRAGQRWHGDKCGEAGAARKAHGGGSCHRAAWDRRRDGEA